MCIAQCERITGQTFSPSFDESYILGTVRTVTAAGRSNGSLFSASSMVYSGWICFLAAAGPEAPGDESGFPLLDMGGVV
jgi:hypothetical protein